jgi:hypothetical protein
MTNIRGTLIVGFLTIAVITLLDSPAGMSKSMELAPANGPVRLRGQATYLEMTNFGLTDLIFCTKRPEGLHFVTTPEHLYLGNETRLTKTQLTNRNGQLVYREGTEQSDMYIPRRAATGWDAWMIGFTRSLADEWTSVVPGKEQFLLKVLPDGQVTVIQPIAFVPSINDKNEFVTEKMVPDLRQTFESSVSEAIIRASESGKLVFPHDATATEAIVSVTFNKDKNLETCLPDVRLVQNVPQDQLSLWTARICTILDTGGLYDVSDQLRKGFPRAARNHFIPDGFYPDVETVGTPSAANSLLTPDAKCYLHLAIADYLRGHQYYEAQALAHRIVNDGRLKHLLNAHAGNSTMKTAARPGWDPRIFGEFNVSYVRYKQSQLQIDKNLWCTLR